MKSCHVSSSTQNGCNQELHNISLMQYSSMQRQKGFWSVTGSWKRVGHTTFTDLGLHMAGMSSAFAASGRDEHVPLIQTGRCTQVLLFQTDQESLLLLKRNGREEDQRVVSVHIGYQLTPSTSHLTFFSLEKFPQFLQATLSYQLCRKPTHKPASW